MADAELLPARAVLFDVGGPIDTEVVHEQLVDRDIRAAFAAEGLRVSSGDLAEASHRAVETFAPDAYQAMIWTLSRGDIMLARAVFTRFRAGSARRAIERGGLEARPGMDRLLRDLHVRGLLLGLAANQPVRALADIDRLGVGHCFSHREVSGHHGLRKPDPRLFLRACEELGVAPAECIMVGDRIDNDIAPARLLGMRTVLFRTGRHIAQQPRTWDERPEVEVWTVRELSQVLAALTPS